MKRALILALLLLPLPSLANEPGHAVVFMYHRFGEDRYPSTSIRLAQFEAQLEYLAANGFQVWPLERIVEHLQNGTAIPDRTVAITVDDAYLSVYREGWPRLKARDWPFTVFVNSDSVDKKLPDFMSWEQMREMAQSGVRFANHGTTHDSLVDLKPGESETEWRERLRADISHGQQRLQEELGSDTNSAPKLFAYPYGEYHEAAAELVQSLGYVAFGQQSGAVGSRADWRSLPRYPMAERYAEISPFAQKAASLPLPVLDVEPWDPLVKGENPPRLRLRLTHKLPGLRCYTSQGELINTRWLEGETASVEVVADKPLSTGRSRYNCTAPAKETGRWHWYSHPWLLTKD